jgi:hypothetical protein
MNTCFDFPAPASGEEDGLHVLAADLGHEAHLRMEALHARGDRDDLLDVLGADQGGDRARRRSP